MSPLLGLDFGLRRIGVALSDPSDTLASAVGTHQADGSLFAYLDELIAGKGVTGIVVGLPITAAGTEGEMARRVRDFARKLEQHTGLSVTLVDERFSSQEAARWLHQGGRRGRPKGAVDAVAAEIILQQFLDERSRQRESDPTGQGEP